MKRKKDPGLIYLNELLMSKYRSYRTGRAYLVSKVGEAKVIEFEEWTHKRGIKAKVNEEVGFYDFKNQNLNMSLAISEVFDSDYLRNICNWISENKELFGKRILDLGCDCGLITCFIAKCFPEAEVVGIDRSERAVECAKELAGRFKLNNVTFSYCDAASYEGAFDTVIYSRVTQENFDEKNAPLFDTFFNASEYYKRQIEGLIGKLPSFLVEDGTLISFEMVDLNPLYFAILRTIIGNGCFVTDTEKLTYTELDDQRSVSVIISKKQSNAEYHEWADKLKKATEDEANQLMLPYLSTSSELIARIVFQRMIEQEMEIGAPQYFEWEANYMLDSTADKLVEGYFLYFDTQSYPYLYSLWTNINDETAIIYFGVPNDNERLNHYVEWSNNDISHKDEMIDMIRRLHKEAIKEGHLVKITKAVYEDNHIMEIEIPLQSIMKDDEEREKYNPLQSAEDIVAYLKK